MIERPQLQEISKASIYLGIPLIAYIQSAVFLLPLTLKKALLSNNNSTNLTQFPTAELSEYCRTPNTYNNYGYTLGTLAFFASAAFSSNMLYTYLSKKKAWSHTQLGHWIIHFLTLLVPCISSAQLNAYNFANCFILFSAGCEGSESFQPNIAFYALTMTALLCTTFGNYIYLNLTYKNELADLHLIKDFITNTTPTKNTQYKLLESETLPKHRIDSIISYLPRNYLEQLKLTNKEQLPEQLQQHWEKSILKLIITQALTCACIYPCYQSSMNYYEYSKISTQYTLKYVTNSRKNFVLVPQISADMSLITNIIIAAICLKNCIIKPLMRSPQCNKVNAVILLSILLPSLCMSAPMAMLTYIDDSLNNLEKFSIAMFSALLTFTFALSGLHNLIATACLQQKNIREETREHVHNQLANNAENSIFSNF